MRNVIAITVGASLLLLPFEVHALAPTSAELSEALVWSEAKFGGLTEVPTPAPGLLVLEQHDPRPFQRDKNPLSGKPLKLGQQEFVHGLFCHAPSRVVV